MEVHTPQILFQDSSIVAQKISCSSLWYHSNLSNKT